MPADTNKKLIIITGPTAAGKTAAAIKVAQHFKTAIISADSRQCYKELNIGVARPSEEELQLVPHYFIASHSIFEDVTAAVFEEYALQKATELFKENDTVVMVGGTGLYIKAFCEGLDAIPPVPAATRQSIIKNYEEQGMEWLQKQVEEKDPLYFEKGEIQNPQRMMRALEVAETTGHSILSFRNQPKAKRDFTIIKTGISLSKEELHRNINTRVDSMMEKGLLEEAGSLKDYRHLNALQTVGYTELFEYFSNNCTLEEAIERIKINTRHYAKRQLTWFKKDEAIKWYDPSGIKEIIALA